MSFKEFEAALRRKFNLDEDGALVGDDMLVHVGKHRSKTALDRFNVTPIADTALHFRASSIMDGADAEVVHVTEPGKYFDHVFCNKREGDLYTVDDFDDFEEEVDIDEYKALTGSEKIERMPFSSTSWQWTYYRTDGSKAYELEYAAGDLRSVSAFDGLGSRTLRQVVSPKSILVINEDGKQVEVRRNDSRTVVICTGDDSAAEEKVAAFGSFESTTSAKDFTDLFEEVFQDVLELDSVRVEVGNFSVGYASLEAYDDVLETTTVLGDGGGDELVVIEEPGKYKGHVYWNSHEEDLACLEDLAEFVEDELEERIDEEETLEEVIANKERLIELLPFFDRGEMAKDLGGLMAKVEVNPKEDILSIIEKLAPV